MDFVTMGGIDVPAIGLGTWRLFGDTCRRTVAEALDMGYRHLDTAESYGNEEEVGAGLRAAGTDRADVFVTTKLGQGSLAPELVEKAADASLARLGLDVLDLLLIHWPADDDTNAAALEAMFALRDAGKVRTVGVSNFTTAQLRRALDVGPVVTDQVEYHPFLGQDRLLRVAAEHDVVLTAYAPLGRGRVVRDATLQRIAERHGKNPAQVALRWLLDHAGVAAIPKAASREHLAANLDVDFSLDDDDREAIDGLARGERLIDPPTGPDWDR